MDSDTEKLVVVVRLSHKLEETVNYIEEEQKELLI